MIKIINEGVLKTREEFDMVIDSLVNSPKFRKYKDFILYIVELAEEEAEKSGESVYDCFNVLLGFPNQDMIDEFNEYYFDISKSSLYYGLNCIMGNLADDIRRVERTIKNNKDKGDIESLVDDYINSLKYPYKQLMEKVKDLYLVFTEDGVVENYHGFTGDGLWELSYDVEQNIGSNQIRKEAQKMIKQLSSDFFTEKQLKKISENQLEHLCSTISIFLDSGVTLKDLFFYDSDVEDSDYEFSEKVAREIGTYSLAYQSRLSKEASNMIKKHMTIKDYPLYRIVSCYGKTFNKKVAGELNVKVGDTIQMETDDGLDRMNNMTSFTSNLNSASMENMQLNRSNGGVRDIVILETVGPVYSFDIDRLTQFAYDVKHCEFEHFVSGEFEVVDIEVENIPDKFKEHPSYRGMVYHIKIKQLHK